MLSQIIQPSILLALSMVSIKLQCVMIDVPKHSSALQKIKYEVHTKIGMKSCHT